MASTMLTERETRGSRLLSDIVRWAPKRCYSTLLGALSRCPIPRGARAPLYRLYARRLGVALDEVAEPLAEYPSFGAFFTRTLRPGARPVAGDPDVAVSPVDGELLEFGRSEEGRLIQAKGCDYTVAALLGDPDRARRYSGGGYATLYLSPRDYHRIHAPVGGHIVECRHVPGDLFPVNARAVRDVAGVYTINERIVTFIESDFGEVAVVMVAACGVGLVTVHHHPGIHTHAPHPMGRHCYEPPRAVEKGCEIGIFHLGSTVIVLFEPGRAVLEPLVRGQRLQVGEALARRRLQSAGGRGRGRA